MILFSGEPFKISGFQDRPERWLSEEADPKRLEET
jgi:hypothetical protein